MLSEVRARGGRHGTGGTIREFSRDTGGAGVPACAEYGMRARERAAVRLLTAADGIDRLTTSRRFNIFQYFVSGSLLCRSNHPIAAMSGKFSRF